MRITGGIAKNRKLISPGSGGKNDIRPTSDRVREAVFSILGDRVYEAFVLDLFAGTGSLGLEALSRGAEQAVFVDNSPRALDIIRRNTQQCFPEGEAKFLKLDLHQGRSFAKLRQVTEAEKPFDLVFLDPPYEKKLAETALSMVDKTGLLAPGGIVLAEERWKASLPERIGRLHLHLHRRYGETGIWLYTNDNTFN